MTPLTTKPSVVLLLAPKGNDVMAVASNIAPVKTDNPAEDPLEVVVTRNLTDFNTAAAGKPFNSTR